MKTLIFILALTLFTFQESPVGVWLYLQDSSKIEISNKDGILSGTLISSKNPGYKPGTQILRNFKYQNGKWWGQLYLINEQHSVDASFELKGDLLLLEYNYGFITKKFHLFRERQPQ